MQMIRSNVPVTSRLSVTFPSGLETLILYPSGIPEMLNNSEAADPTDTDLLQLLNNATVAANKENAILICFITTSFAANLR